MDGYTVVEVWVLVDGQGNWVCHADRAQLKEQYESDIGELDGTEPVRIVRATVNVPTPKVVELCATVAEEPASGELKVAG